MRAMRAMKAMRAMMAMMLMISVEYWSWRGLWTLPSEVVWTLDDPSTVGPQPSHTPHDRGGGTS